MAGLCECGARFRDEHGRRLVNRNEPGSTSARERKLTYRLRKKTTDALYRFLEWTVPAVYNAYMWFVFRTSRVEYENTDLLWMMRERFGGLVGIMWHQDVFTVAWSFRDYEGHTLASPGELGSLITAMLERNGFVVFRGGSTRSKRRRRRVLPDMIEHMRNVPGVAFGITCDGSNGPPYRVKSGSIAIAHACAKPMILARTWCRRRIDLPGWDHSYIPLPFNHIVQVFAGPYFVPPTAEDPAVFEGFRKRIEGELLELTYYAHERIGDVPAEPRFGFPAGWRPTWNGKLPQPCCEPEANHPAFAEAGARPTGAGARQRQDAAVARDAAAHRYFG